MDQLKLTSPSEAICRTMRTERKDEDRSRYISSASVSLHSVHLRRARLPFSFLGSPE